MGAWHWSWTASPAFVVLLAKHLAGHLSTRQRRDFAMGYICIGPVATAFTAGPGYELAFSYSFVGNGIVSPSRRPSIDGYHPFLGQASDLCTARRQRFVANGLCLLTVLPSRLGAGNSILVWAHFIPQVRNVSQCWVCTELPTSVAEEIPWHKTLATASKCTELHSLQITRD